MTRAHPHGWLKPRIAHLLDAGIPRGEIAKRLGCTRNYVNGVAAMIGLAAERRGPEPIIQMDRLLDMRKRGLTRPAAAAVFGVHPDSLHDFCRRHEINWPDARPKIDPAEVDALLARGMAVREVSRQLGLSVSAVGMHLHRRKRAGAISDAGLPIPATPHTHYPTETVLSTNPSVPFHVATE